MSAAWPVAVRRYGWVPGDPPGDLALGAPQNGGIYTRALVLLERDDVPWGVVGVAAPDGIVRAAALERAVADQIAGEPWALAPGPRDPASRLRVRVVMTSRQDSWRVVRAVGALVVHPDPDLEIVVVDQDPDVTQLARVLAEAFPDEARLSVRDARRPGRAHARNRGAEDATDGLIAFLDDELVAHPLWVDALRDAMGGERSGVGLGRMLPLALETEAQWLWFRASASGRRLEASARLGRPAIWEPGGTSLRAGAFDGGLCLSAAAFARLGGFDARLGAGTPSRGGEDIDIVLRARRAGDQVWDVPRAVVWREYADALPDAERAAFARGVGVSATMTKQLVAGPGAVGRLQSASRVMRLGHTARLRAVPDAASESRSPRKLIVLERLGLIAGPLAFARSALRGRGAPQ